MSVWKLYIIPIFTFSLLYNIPKFLELTVMEVDCTRNLTVTNQTICTKKHEDADQVEIIQPTSLRLSPFYVKYYLIYLNFLINAIIPLISLLILNSLISRKVNIKKFYAWKAKNNISVPLCG